MDRVHDLLLKHSTASGRARFKSAAVVKPQFTQYNAALRPQTIWTITVLGTREPTENGHLDFHTAPEL